MNAAPASPAPTSPSTSAAPGSSPWPERIRSLALEFEQRAAAADHRETFVAENYAALKAARFFTAAIPAELGGGGVPHSEMCDLLRIIGQHCGSTGLALAMHQHLLAAMIWRFRQGQISAGETLKMVAQKQPVLVSTGARDWLESNGTAQKVDGGFLVSGLKQFASQAAGGDILVTSAPCADGEASPTVIHFTVPFSAKGVSVLDDWHTLGMRGTGSHSVRLEKVFVPDSAITLQRPQGQFHPLFNVILSVASPLITAVYLGIAQKAAQLALAHTRKRNHPKPHVVSALGAMHNDLVDAELNWRDMIRLANNFNFAPTDQQGHDVATRKTNATKHCIAVVTQAMAIVGGQAYYRDAGLERLFRDVQAARYHPLQEADQLQFSGEVLMKNSPA